jgi:rare lipoprotein A
MLRRMALCLCLAMLCLALSATTLAPKAHADTYECEASYYGYELAGALTASGEPFAPEGYTAAHWTYEFGTILYVENLWTGYGVYVTVNDRGPATWTGRCLDMSLGAAEVIGMTYSGYAPVQIEEVYIP